MERATLVLCGGRSRRMGMDKARLPFGGESMLAHVVRRAQEVTPEVWIVARHGQSLPEDLDPGLPIARDEAPGHGPLAGLIAGLEACAAPRVCLLACDNPLVASPLVERLFALSLGHDAAVPDVDGHLMVTTAVYARSALAPARALLASGDRALRQLVRRTRTRRIPATELREVDPDLRSFQACNSPDEYRRALALAGISEPAMRSGEPTS